jgi:hypothetical protein
MKQVSQRTIVRMMEFWSTAAPASVSRLLYEHDFPDWFVTHAMTSYHLNWDKILIALRNGQFFFPGYFGDYTNNITGKYLSENEARSDGEFLIQRLAALATTLPKSDSVANSLELDGFAVNRKSLRLVTLEGAVSAQQEEDALTRLVKQTGIGNADTIVKHVADANSLYIEQKYHPSLNESRNLIQCLVDNISEDTHRSDVHIQGLPGGTANRIQYLREVSFLTPDEESAFKSAWGALSAGSHPGVPEREEARIGLVLALEFGQLLLLKFMNWKKYGYRGFS